MQTWLEKNYKLCLILLCIFSFAVRVYRIGEIKSYIFDEVYHVVTDKLISRNDPRAYEWWNTPIEPGTAVDWLHPPLAKYTQALGIKLFGETPFGWRISSVVFGTAVIYVTAQFATYIFGDKKLGLLAGFLAAMDGLLLVQSRLAMNDIHVTFFLILTFFSYLWYRRTLQEVIDDPKKLLAAKVTLRRRLILSAVCAGLAMGSKWSGLFGLGVLWFFEFIFLITELHKVAHTTQQALSTILGRVAIFTLIPATIYILSYSHMFLQGKSLICTLDQARMGQCYCSQESSWWVNVLKDFAGGDGTAWEKLEARGGCKRLISHFSELHHQIWWYQTTLKATHAYQSRPYQWFFDLRPVWMYVKYDDGTIANIYSQGNPILFWAGDVAILVTLLILLLNSVRLLMKKPVVKTKKVVATFSNWLMAVTNFETVLGKLFYLAVAYLAVWFPWNASPRIMFFYHYTPAVPLLAIILAYWMMRIWGTKYGRMIDIVLLVFVTGTFIVFFPNWTGIPVSTEFANKVYFSLKSWK